MSKIRTVLWDVGGVLLTNGWDHVQRYALLERFGLDREDFERRHAEANDAWEKSLMTVDEYLTHTIFYTPRSFTPEDFIARMKDESQILPNTALPVLHELAGLGEVELGILNNESRELNDYRVATFELWNYFDVFLSSCYVALRKPDARIYRLALDVLQRPADEVAFIDDRPENAAAATAVGMHGIRYENTTQLRQALGVLGVALN